MRRSFIRKALVIITVAPLLFVPFTPTNKFPTVEKASAQMTVSDFASANAKDRLISDIDFVDVNSMSVADIQAFIANQGSFLKDFSEGGRTAAQIIYDAAHGHGDASETANGIVVSTTTGTVSPKIILVTLQKEQSLMTKTSRDDRALGKAMGYACPDNGSSNDTNNNGCNDTYEGFTKQVESAAWQFRYNYEAAKLGADWWNTNYPGQEQYYVGMTKTFTDYNGASTVNVSNAATASLYRYTPHVYNGNYNFWKLFSGWFQYGAAFVSQSGYPMITQGEAAKFVLTLKNTGKVTWTQDIVHLGTDRSLDRVPAFIRESGAGSPNPSGWAAINRIRMNETSVAPGDNGTFTFYMQAPANMPFGTYHEYFRPVADGFGWMEDSGIYWDVRVARPAEMYQHTFVSQSSYPTLLPGEAARFELTVKNTGNWAWTPDVVKLGTDRNRDRVSKFVRESGAGSPNPSGWADIARVKMQQSYVAPGENATFVFYMQAPATMTPGTYREYFRLVADGITWMEDYGIFWDVKVNSTADAYSHSFVSGSTYPTISRGEAGKFTLTVKNTGNITWNQDTVHLGTDRSRDRVSKFIRESGAGSPAPSGWSAVNRVKMQQDSVAPGENATFVFYMQAPNDMPTGVYHEYFRLVADGIKWMEDYGIYWDVTVQ